MKGILGAVTFLFGLFALYYLSLLIVGGTVMLGGHIPL
jgi:hypothetical protein